MPSLTTAAVVLHVMPYGETSKIVRLLTQEAGLLSGIARGTRSKKSRTGPRLDLFAAGAATLLIKDHRDLHPLTTFEITNSHAGLAHDVTKFAAASALSELALKSALAEPQPHIHDSVLAGFDALEAAPAELAQTVALVAMWGLIGALGFSPTLDRCAVCGVATGAQGHGGTGAQEARLYFSAEQGGALCARHRSAAPFREMKGEDAEVLVHLISGRLPDMPLDARYAAAHRRLLVRFIRHHLAEHRALPALAFWDALP